MIEVRQLSKSYGAHRAVADLTFTVDAGAVVGFLGPNGAGKSTTLRILSGYLAPTSGSARVAGRDVVGDNLEVRRRIGYLPENNPLYEEMEAAEYLEFCARVRGLAGKRLTRSVRAAVEACTLGDLLGRPLGLLSKGQRQRVGLGAAILHEPQVLLLDEPTAGLDPHQTAQVRALIARLKEDKTVLLSTHVLSEVEASCDRVVILNEGRIAAEGAPAELAAAAGGGSLRATLAAGPTLEDVRMRLAALDAVAAVETERRGGEILATVTAESGADLRRALFEAAVREKWTLLGLERRGADLESVFKRLTPRGEERP